MSVQRHKHQSREQWPGGRPLGVVEAEAKAQRRIADRLSTSVGDGALIAQLRARIAELEAELHEQIAIIARLNRERFGLA